MNETLLLFLLNAAWQVTLVALLVSASDRLLRSAAARYRHALWVAALAACIAFALSSPLRISPAPPTLALPSPSAIGLDQHGSGESAATMPAREHAEDAAKHASGRWTLYGIAVPKVTLSKPLALTIATVYGLLLLHRALVLLRAWRRTRAVLRSARRIELSPRAAEALACCRQVFGLGPVAVLSSPEVAVPITAGTVHPVLVLPEGLLDDDDADLLICALGHESAHIARRDYLLNLVYEFVSLPLWFHPAIRLVLRRIRQTRELSCDEMVTEQLLEARIYAQSLVQLAGAALPFGRPAATITVGIADADILEERIMSILKHSSPRLRRPGALLLVATLLFVVPCLAAAPFAVRVVIHQPALAGATGQTGSVAPVSLSNEQPQAAAETITILTPDGPVIASQVHAPKVGDVVTVGDRRLKIVALGPQGQYRARVLGSEASSGLAEKPQNVQARLRERAEGNGGDAQAGEPSEQERVAREKRERAEREERSQRQAELARQAKITIDQAMQIAQHEAPGTVVAARLIGEPGGPPTYFISILQQNGTKTDTVYVLVNALDGSVMPKSGGKQEP
ncbi:MAG TPA: M56 family metallopeptidase [Candidatus Angelobacter sp.]